MIDRLRRVTDLFIEGETLYMGMDDDGQPVTLWVNKLNSFEVEESRRDGMAARGLRLMELQADNSTEFLAAQHLVKRWSDEELFTVRVSQLADDLYLDVMNDLEADDEWSEKIQLLRRMPQMLEDEKAPEDDPRRKQLHELNVGYLEQIRNRQEASQKKAFKEVGKQGRENVERDYFEAWRNRTSLDEYMETRRMSEMFFSLRDCSAQEGEGSTAESRRWNHSACSHGRRLLESRSQVRELPEEVITRVVDALDGIVVSERAAGNSDAPASSSASSEQASASEVPSTPSTPVETPPVAPTT